MWSQRLGSAPGQTGSKSQLWLQLHAPGDEDEPLWQASVSPSVRRVSYSSRSSQAVPRLCTDITSVSVRPGQTDQFFSKG